LKTIIARAQSVGKKKINPRNSKLPAPEGIIEIIPLNKVGILTTENYGFQLKKTPQGRKSQAIKPAQEVCALNRPQEEVPGSSKPLPAGRVHPFFWASGVFF